MCIYGSRESRNNKSEETKNLTTAATPWIFLRYILLLCIVYFSLPLFISLSLLSLSCMTMCGAHKFSVDKNLLQFIIVIIFICRILDMKCLIDRETGRHTDIGTERPSQLTSKAHNNKIIFIVRTQLNEAATI